MPVFQKNPLIFQKLAPVLLLAALAGCVMPDKPDGIDTPSMRSIADKMRASGDDEGAVDFYQRELQRDPNDIAARQSLAEILEKHGDHANAAMEYREALRVKPDDNDLWRALARSLVAEGQYANAKDAYEKALQEDSSDAKALNGLGVTLDYLGQHDAAQKAYLGSLDKNPDDMAVLSNLGHSYVLTGAYDQAIALLEPHVKDKDATAALRQNLAEAYGMAGMMADAERMARMDLSPAQVKHNLDYYRARRAQLTTGPTLYADLGSFPTNVIAATRVDEVKSKFAKDIDGLIIAASPEVQTIGGTPSFSVRVTGFVHTEKLRAFCEKLKQADIACKAHEK